MTTRNRVETPTEKAKHTLVKTVVTVERVSADGTTRRVEHQWESPGRLDMEYRLDQPRNSYYYRLPGATITLTLENPTDALARAKAAHGR